MAYLLLLPCIISLHRNWCRRSQVRLLSCVILTNPSLASGRAEMVFLAGHQWCDIEKCVKWMVPFALVIREAGSSKLKQFRGVPAEDAHNIQTHLNSLGLLVSTPPPPDRSARLLPDFWSFAGAAEGRTVSDARTQPCL